MSTDDSRDVSTKANGVSSKKKKGNAMALLAAMGDVDDQEDDKEELQQKKPKGDFLVCNIDSVSKHPKVLYFWK